MWGRPTVTGSCLWWRCHVASPGGAVGGAVGGDVDDATGVAAATSADARWPFVSTTKSSDDGSVWGSSPAPSPSSSPTSHGSAVETATAGLFGGAVIGRRLPVGAKKHCHGVIGLNPATGTWSGPNMGGHGVAGKHASAGVSGAGMSLCSVGRTCIGSPSWRAGLSGFCSVAYITPRILAGGCCGSSPFVAAAGRCFNACKPGQDLGFTLSRFNGCKLGFGSATHLVQKYAFSPGGRMGRIAKDHRPRRI